MDTTTYTSSSPLIHNLPLTNSSTLKTTNFHKIAGLLSASLYRFPIPSAIREILQNALDANKASKTTNKVKIILPCNNSPFISIQDFGLGISPEFFSQLYCDLGYSTKSKDNNYTGGFGIGKLAPLSFCSQLFINSVCNNEEHTYIITKEDNQFSFKHLSSSPTSAPSGTTVKFPCEASRHREVSHAVFYFCEFIPSLVEIYEWCIDGHLRKNSILDEHLKYFQSSEIVITRKDSLPSSVIEPIHFSYFLPRNAANYSLGTKSYISIPVLLSFLIGDIAYSLSASLKNQLHKYSKEDLKDKTIKFEVGQDNLKIYPFFSDSLNNSKHLREFSNLEVTLVHNHFRDIYTAESHPSLKIEDNLTYHNIVVQLPPNAVTLTSSREFIQDTPQNNSFLIDVIYAVLSKIVYIENSLPRQYEHLIQQGDLGQFLYEMIDPAFLEERFSYSHYSNSISIQRDDNASKGFPYKNTIYPYTIYPSVDPRIKNSTITSSYCPTATSYFLLQVPYDSKLFRTKQFINSYITENFCYNAKSDGAISLLNCNLEDSFVTDFSFKSFHQEGSCNTLSPSHCQLVHSFDISRKYPNSNTGVFIQCSSPSFTSFCKHLEWVKVLTKCSKLTDKYYCTKRGQQNKANHLEFTYFLSFFSHTRKGYIVYYEYETNGNLKVKSLINRLQKQYPDCVDWDILFVPYNCRKYKIAGLLDNFVAEKSTHPKQSPDSAEENEEVYCKSDLTRFLNYFRSSVIILDNDLEEKTLNVAPKRRSNKVEKSTLQIASSAIKSGGFYTLDPTKNNTTQNTSNTICSPFKYCKTYDVSVLTNTLPETPPGIVNVVYSTSKDCGSYNYTIEDVIPPNLDFNRVYFASDSVKSLLLKCPFWISIEEYCFQQYTFYLEEYKEVFELFDYSFPNFLVGSCTSSEYEFPSYEFSSLEHYVRTFVHKLFSLVNFLPPNVKTKLLKLLKEDWKVIQWMNALYWTPISLRSDKTYGKQSSTIEFKIPNLSDSEKEVKRVKICNVTSDNGLFTTWVSSNKAQEKFFEELFSCYPLLQSVMLNLISCRKQTPFNSLSLDHPIFDYLRHENSKHSN